MQRFSLPARRFPAGVDPQFDDIESDCRELTRLALGGHVFEARAMLCLLRERFEEKGCPHPSTGSG